MKEIRKMASFSVSKGKTRKFGGEDGQKLSITNLDGVNGIITNASGREFKIRVSGRQYLMDDHCGDGGIVVDWYIEPYADCFIVDGAMTGW